MLPGQVLLQGRQWPIAAVPAANGHLKDWLTDPPEADGGHGSVAIMTGAAGVVPVRPTEIRPGVPLIPNPAFRPRAYDVVTGIFRAQGYRIRTSDTVSEFSHSARSLFGEFQEITLAVALAVVFHQLKPWEQVFKHGNEVVDVVVLPG